MLPSSSGATARLSALLAIVIVLALPSIATASEPFLMGLHEPAAFVPSPERSLVERMAGANAEIARGAAVWSQIAPNAATRPAGFDARNPADPNYTWTALDGFVKATAGAGMQPLITSLLAPNWAEGTSAADRAKRTGHPGTYRPNPRDYGDFAYAMAKRYSGRFPDPAVPGTTLPRVRLFQAWNEPNFGEYLTVPGKGKAAGHYSRMLNAFYAAVKSVVRSNKVLSAGMGPYGFNGHATDVDPQLFNRQLFCLEGRSTKLSRAKRCNGPIPHFDIFTHHPYTLTGTPTSKAGSPDGGALGNMAEIKRMLTYAAAHGRVLPRGRPSLWVTEFSWYSNPPGRAPNGTELGKPLGVQARYLSATAYHLWRLGVGAMVWYNLDDVPVWPGGLYFQSGKAKPALRAFRLPFYAGVSRSRLNVWANLSGSAARAKVRLERRSAGRWHKVDTLTADSHGIVWRRLAPARAGVYRIVVLSGTRKGDKSLPYQA